MNYLESFAFSLAYLVPIVLGIMYLLSTIKRKPKWVYGICNGKIARRNKRGEHNVQYILWKAGQCGHLTDFWYDFDECYWIKFRKNK